MSTSDTSIGRRVVHSSAWLYGRRLLSGFFGLFVTALLARKLAPSDFGTVALANVILNLLATVGPAGIKSFIVYDRQEGREERVQSAFWLGIVGTLAATVICFALSPLVTRYYGTPGLEPILNALIVQFALTQMSIIPDALLQRALDFKKLVLRDSILEVLTGVGMVIMAYAGCGVWSLILPSLLATPFRVMLTFKLAKWKPAFPRGTSAWPRIFRYSFHTTGGGFVTFLINEGDSLLIGRTLGLTDLGLYNRAWVSANMVSKNVTRVVADVAMPALSAVANEAERLRAAMGRMLRMLAMASFPLLIGLLIVADLFVMTLYGPKWEASVLPMQILIIYALRQTVGGPAAVVYRVMGRPDIGFKLGLAFLPFYFASIWLGSSHGIIGVAVGVTAARTVYGMIQFAVVARLLGQGFWEFLAPMGQPFLAACIFGGGIVFARTFLDFLRIPAAGEFGILVLFGGILWIVLLARLFPTLLLEGLSVTDHLPRAVGLTIRKLLKPIMNSCA